ncbi:membrane protein insertion efficiency factor YidD [Blastococcus capsensis]|uniref:membrane protein insertion efficiency factor YidD n=1 Tax=Blastococcus capsensis TaxID=1564163 RepID=UPI00254184D2|nr:membrane protein insertion efficiency factor YidD [Blastococcus capsensis]MDK3255143.1 membrane protein insertion efficiency factor YidD [Blastococcus capsensis]
MTGVPGAVRRPSPAARLLIGVVGFYSRAVSPALPARCRFHPTCSSYATEAVAVHGAGRGTWLALVRLLKCAPWHAGGVDLVPPAAALRGTGAAARSSSSGARPCGEPSDDPGREATAPAPCRTPQEESSVV